MVVGQARGSGDGSPPVGSRGKATVGVRGRSPSEAEAQCEINEHRSRAWTVYFANTQFRNMLKIQWGFKRPDPPLGTPLSMTVTTRVVKTLQQYVIVSIFWIHMEHL